jgi:uncharacterized membrane-anchored protein YhcB (DUF1043 family)
MDLLCGRAMTWRRAILLLAIGVAIGLVVFRLHQDF